MVPVAPSLALLFAPPDDAGGVPAAPVGGVSVLERQRRLARAAGVRRVVVVGTPAAALSPDPATFVVADPGALAHLVIDDGPVLMIAPGLVVDADVAAAVIAAPVPAIGTWPAHGRCRGVERIDAHSVAGGIGVYPAAMVRAVAAQLGDWDLQSTLLRTALTEGAGRVDLCGLGAPVWAIVADDDSAGRTTATLIAAAARPRPGWPARLLFPPVEAAAVRLLLPVPLNETLGEAIVVGLAVLAGVAFAASWLMTGLVLALMCAPLAGITGRLVRVRLEARDAAWVPGWLIDLGWSAAIVAGVAARGGGTAAWACGALLIGFGVAERRQRGFVRRVISRDLDAMGAFEQRFALVAARRDVLLWTWLPLAALGLWQAWLVALAAHATISFFVVQARSFTRVAAGPAEPAA